jgi:hypothetical protein
MDMGSSTFESGGDEHGRRTHRFYPGRGFLLICFCCVFVLSRVEDVEREQGRIKRVTKLIRKTQDDHPAFASGWSLIPSISLISAEHQWARRIDLRREVSRVSHEVCRGPQQLDQV